MLQVRPLNQRELNEGHRVCTHFDDETGQVALTVTPRSSDHRPTFHRHLLAPVFMTVYGTIVWLGIAEVDRWASAAYLRPMFNTSNILQHVAVCLQAVDRNTLLQLKGATARGYAFDRRYGMDDTSDKIFSECVEALVNNVFKACI